MDITTLRLNQLEQRVERLERLIQLLIRKLKGASIKAKEGGGDMSIEFHGNLDGDFVQGDKR